MDKKYEKICIKKRKINNVWGLKGPAIENNEKGDM